MLAEDPDCGARRAGKQLCEGEGAESQLYNRSFHSRLASTMSCSPDKGKL